MKQFSLFFLLCIFTCASFAMESAKALLKEKEAEQEEVKEDIYKISYELGKQDFPDLSCEAFCDMMKLMDMFAAQGEFSEEKMHKLKVYHRKKRLVDILSKRQDIPDAKHLVDEIKSINKEPKFLATVRAGIFSKKNKKDKSIKKKKTQAEIAQSVETRKAEFLALIEERTKQEQLPNNCNNQ